MSRKLALMVLTLIATAETARAASYIVVFEGTVRKLVLVANLTLLVVVAGAWPERASAATEGHFDLWPGDSVFWEGPTEINSTEETFEYEIAVRDAGVRLRVAVDISDGADPVTGLLLNTPAEPLDNADAFTLELFGPDQNPVQVPSGRYSSEAAVANPATGIWRARVRFSSASDATFRMRAKLEEELPNPAGSFSTALAPVVTVDQAPDPDGQATLYGSEFGGRPLADFEPDGLGSLPVVVADDPGENGCAYAAGSALTQAGRHWIAVAREGEQSLPDNSCPDRQLKMSIAEAAGADGIIVIGSQGLPGTLTLRRTAGDIPGVLVSHDEGGRLVDATRIHPDLEDVSVTLDLITDRSKVLLPNLRLTPPFDFSASQYAATTGIDPSGCMPSELATYGARRCLRFSFGPETIGGRLELHFGAAEGGANPGGGTVIQHIYRADGSVETREAGTYEFHEQHLHYHYAGFDTTELFRVTNAARGEMEPAMCSSSPLGSPVPCAGPKVGFCMGDYLIARWFRFSNEPGPPSRPSNCLHVEDPLTEKIVGLAAGWADVYKYYLDGNYVEFADNPTGEYVVRVRGNADDTIHETTTDDNSSYAWIVVEKDALSGAIRVVEVKERGYGESPWDPHKKLASDIRNSLVEE